MGSLNWQQPADILSRRLEMHEEQNNVSCSRGEGYCLYFCHFLPLGQNWMTLSQPVRPTLTAGEQRHLAIVLENQGFLNQRRGEHDKKELCNKKFNNFKKLQFLLGLQSYE